VPPGSLRSSRTHVSWTASSASLTDPSIRYATARRWDRCRSNCSANQSRRSTAACHPRATCHREYGSGSADVTWPLVTSPRDAPYSV
jgi:hypothetical protein